MRDPDALLADIVTYSLRALVHAAGVGAAIPLRNRSNHVFVIPYGVYESRQHLVQRSATCISTATSA